VKVAPQPDPRNMKTQKAMYVLKREEAQKALVEMGIAPPTTAAVPPPVAEAPRSRAWIGVLIAILVLAGLAAFAIQYWLGSVTTEAPSSASTSTVATTATAAPTPTRAAPTPKPPSTATPAPAAKAAAASAPAEEPAEEPATKPAAKRNPKKDEPRPINE
jgi:hypothetical protein